MIKSKNSKVTRDIPLLTIDVLLDVVVKYIFLLLSLGWYLFKVVIDSRYPPSWSNENALCITSTGNVFVASWIIPLVTIPLWDLVMILWIRWIRGSSFRKNSTERLSLFWDSKIKLSVKIICLICHFYHMSLLWIESRYPNRYASVYFS